MSISKPIRLRIAKWGNSLALRLPRAIALEFGGAGSKVGLLVRAGPVRTVGHGASSGFGEDDQRLLADSRNEAVIGTWGNSLAVRLPVELVAQLGLKEEDMVILTVDRETIEVTKQRSRAEALASFRSLRGLVTGSVKFPREDLLLRGRDVDD